MRVKAYLNKWKRNIEKYIHHVFHGLLCSSVTHQFHLDPTMNRFKTGQKQFDQICLEPDQNSLFNLVQAEFCFEKKFLKMQKNKSYI